VELAHAHSHGFIDDVGLVVELRHRSGRLELDDRAPSEERQSRQVPRAEHLPEVDDLVGVPTK
jgi:hypothetical protein